MTTGPSDRTRNDEVRDQMQRDFYREFFKRSADAYLIIENETFVDCNRATVDMLLYETREQLLQTHPAQLSPEMQPDGRRSFEKANEMIAIALKHGSHRFEWDHVRADGEVFPVEVLLTAVPKDDGLVLHTTWRDITNRKRLESQLRLAQKLEAVGKLAGGIAHDFNNLLVAIIGNSELIEMNLEPDSPLMEYVSEIRGAGARAAELVGQLLAYSRKQVLRTRVFDLNEVLCNVGPMLRHLIGEDIVTTLTQARTPLIVKADGGQLEQVVMNLATNARDAMPDGGHLAMEIFRAELTDEDIPSGSQLAPGHYAALRVTDDGMGIPPALRHLIFDPFFTTKPMGNGLGLSTVFGIVRQSGGDIAVASKVDQGTAMTVYLPLSQETPSTTPEVEQIRETKTETGETILLVEDEPSVAVLAERVLQGAGYSVFCARDGRQALDLVEAESLEFDLLFTDVVMPNLDGPELARRLEEQNPGLKVLYCSGYTNEALTTRGVLEEDVELIQKPYGTEQLKRRIRSLLDAE